MITLLPRNQSNVYQKIMVYKAHEDGIQVGGKTIMLQSVFNTLNGRF